jgi:hypothetical protein
VSGRWTIRPSLPTSNGSSRRSRCFLTRTCSGWSIWTMHQLKQSYSSASASFSRIYSSFGLSTGTPSRAALLIPQFLRIRSVPDLQRIQQNSLSLASLLPCIPLPRSYPFPIQRPALLSPSLFTLGGADETITLRLPVRLSPLL